MPGLRLVSDETAGHAAVGILVPPGTRTILIVRPRSLAWDLVLVQSAANPAFREMNQAEGRETARALFEALLQWTAGGPGHAAPAVAEAGSLVWIDVGDFSLVACERRPNQPYRPMVFVREEDARQAAGSLAGILNPPPGADQEVYFNIRHFVR